MCALPNFLKNTNIYIYLLSPDVSITRWWLREAKFTISLETALDTHANVE